MLIYYCPALKINKEIAQCLLDNLIVPEFFDPGQILIPY